jgi:hypothetical protein
MARVTLTNGGVDLVADVEGPARGPTTLLLHAGGETRSVWRPISNELVDAETCDIDAGHLVARNRPRELARALTAFLAQVLGR